MTTTYTAFNDVHLTGQRPDSADDLTLTSDVDAEEAFRM